MANKNIKGITVEIGGDTTGLDKALKKVNDTSVKLKSELKEVNNGLKMNPSSVELLSQKSTLLAQAVNNAKEKVDSLRMVQSQVEEQFRNGDIGEEAYRAFNRELIQSESELKKLESQLKTANSDLNEFGKAGGTAANQQKELAAAAENDKNKQEELNKKIEDGKAALAQWGQAAETVKDIGVKSFELIAGAVAATSAAVVAGAKASVDAYNEVYEGTENVIKATGATGQAADELNESYKKVASTVNADFGAVGSALGEVNTRFGYVGSELEAATTNFLKFADITGTDATRAVQLVSRAMFDAGIETDEYQTVLDELAVAAQASGISVETLTQNIAKYGAPLRAIGMDTKESISLFAAWEKAGVNVETSLAGVRAAIGKWGKEGKDAREEFQKTLDAIAAAPDIADATAMAIDVFGQKAGADLADAIQGGRFEYQEFIDLLDNSIGTVTKTYEETQNASDKIAVAFNGLKVAGSEVGEALSDVMGDYLTEGIEMATEAIEDLNLDADKIKKKIQNEVAPVISQIKDKVKEVIDFVSSHKEDILSAIEDIKSVISDVYEVVKDVISWIIDNWETVVAALAAIGAALLAFNVVTMIQGLVAAFQAWQIAVEGLTAKEIILNAVMAANPIGLVIAAVAALVAAFIVLWNTNEDFRQFWIDLWAEIQKTVSNFIDYWKIGVEMIKDGFNAFINTDFMQRVIYHFSQIIDFVKNVFVGDWSAAWENVKNIFKNIWDGFVDIIRNPMNEMIALINAFIMSINGMIENINQIKIDIPEWLPEIGGEKFGFDLPKIPSIPMLARGGILSAGSAIVGEAGAELLTIANGKAVVQPLSSGNSSENVLNSAQYPQFNSDIVINSYMYPSATEFTQSIITAQQINNAVTGGR